jgi:hypothetical protein
MVRGLKWRGDKTIENGFYITGGAHTPLKRAEAGC